MADYRDSERERTPKHCGAAFSHSEHWWTGTYPTSPHVCTGNLAPVADPTTEGSE